MSLREYIGERRESFAIALGLLLIPGTWAGRKSDPLRPANDDVLEGEFKREPDDLLR